METDNLPEVIVRLDCSCIVNRVMLRARQIDPDTGDFLPDMFMLRSKEEGLSVDIASMRDVETTVSSFKKVHGVGSLHIGRIREIRLTPPKQNQLKLDVEHRPKPSNSAHSEIIGVPRPEHNEADAEYIAGKLAEMCRKIWP